MRNGSVHSSSWKFFALAILLCPLWTNAQEVLRDPTRPYYARAATGSSNGGGARAGAVTTFNVTAIFTSDLRRVAVVNGQRVIEGDRVDGATVIEILTDRLTLNVGGKVITHRVLPYGFRK